MEIEKTLKLKIPTALTAPLGKGQIGVCDVIQQHCRYSSEYGLDKNIGDHFLCTTNPIFLAIRKNAMERGYTFSTNPPYPYFALPLLGLDSLLKSKIIPYHDNFYWLKKINVQWSGRFALKELYKCGLQQNYTLHEAAHAVAHHITKPLLRIPSDPSIQNENLVRLFMNEAFANTVEALGGIFIYNKIGGYFFWMNSYLGAGGRKHKILLRLAYDVGLKHTAKLLFLFFLYSNFTYRKLSTKEYVFILNAVGASKKERSIYKKIFSDLTDITFSLSKGFRTNTAQLYLTSHGYPRDVLHKLDFDPCEYIIKNSNLLKDFEKLISIALSSVSADLI